MKTKNLYVLTADSGDGSRAVYYTFNEKWILLQEEMNTRGELDWEDIGVDGDGFHYDVLTVPEECTLESLGIRYDVGDKRMEYDD